MREPSSSTAQPVIAPFSHVTSLAIITHEAIRDRMAGPAIRALELARAVAPEVRPILASPFPVTRDIGGVEARTYRFDDPSSIERAVAGADAVLVQGFTLYKFPWLIAQGLPVVVDLYCPFQLENLERRRLVEPSRPNRAMASEVERHVVVQQIERGDFFLCASERQRDFWLGMLAALGRVAPATYDGDPTLSSLIAVVPFGLDASPPAATAHAVKGVIAGIAEGDRVLVWGGSVTDWQDPLTPIRAVERVAARIEGVRLVFPSGIPSAEVPPMRALDEARHEAERLRLAGRHVFFVDWVPYDQRATYLLDAEIGVSAHLPTLETRFAWRTRMLDYIWATLPIVCTRGDALAELVDRRELGVVVEPGDDRAMADGFLRLLGDAAFARGCRERLAVERDQLHWRRVAEPLRRFALSPRRAPDAGRSRPQGPPARRSVLARVARVLGQSLRHRQP